MATHCKDEPVHVEICQEHSGLKAIVIVILCGTISNIGLLAYNTFIATAALKNDVIQSVTELKGKFAVLEQTDRYMMDEINDCKMRISKIEGKPR